MNTIAPALARSKRAVSFTSSRKRGSQRAAIEMLGKLNDRRSLALTAGNCAALIELAIEYEMIHCPRLASEIRTEAENL